MKFEAFYASRHHWARDIAGRALGLFRRTGEYTRWRLGRVSLVLASRYAKVNQDAKCPACGHRHGRIETSVKEKLIQHTCHVCGAEWGEPFVVSADLWLRK